MSMSQQVRTKLNSDLLLTPDQLGDFMGKRNETENSLVVGFS